MREQMNTGHKTERSPLSLNLDGEALRPLIAAVVAETMAAVQRDQETLGDRLAYSEAEAAGLLGLNVHQLRDERLRGRIGASVIVGRRVRYTRADLTAYLAAQRSEAKQSE